jgi:adenylate cyclase class 2
MNEIEVKILNVTQVDLSEKLQLLGAKKIFEGELYAMYFDTPTHELRSKQITLRLRQEGERVVLCTKQKMHSESVKSEEEIEIEVSDINKTNEILANLGFAKYFALRKRRVSYDLQNAKIEFDKYLGEHSFVPEFFEIEAKSEKEVFRIANILGFEKSDCKNWSSKEVIKYYQTLQKEENNK